MENLIFTAIIVAGIVSGLAFVTKHYWTFKSVLAKEVSKEKKKEESVTGYLSKQIDNADKNIIEIDKIISEQKAKGATEQQLKPLLDRKKLLEIGQNYGFVIKPFLPIADGLIMKITKVLK